MENPVAKKDLVDSILELRTEAERRLMRNKYFVAIKKLDELLEAIQPLDAQVIEEDAERSSKPAEPAALTDETGGLVEQPTPEQAEVTVEAAPAEELQPEATETYEAFATSGSVLDEFERKNAERVDDTALFEPEQSAATPEQPATSATGQADLDADFDDDEAEPSPSKVQAAE